jgi:hypothetical protein
MLESGDFSLLGSSEDDPVNGDAVIGGGEVGDDGAVFDEPGVDER